jgi:hypothetical protein
MPLLLLISAIGFFMLLGSIFPNRRRTHFPPNSYPQNPPFYQPQQPNLYYQQPNSYYQQPHSPRFQQGENNPLAFLYTLVFMAAVMGFMYFSA